VIGSDGVSDAAGTATPPTDSSSGMSVWWRLMSLRGQCYKRVFKYLWRLPKLAVILFNATLMPL
jgi:hypothetical protein